MDEQNQLDQSPNKKFKIKEPLNSLELQELLRGWLNALDEEKDFEFSIKGHRGVIPSAALMSNRTRGEYEFKDDEFEFELELKWKDEKSSVQ